MTAAAPTSRLQQAALASAVVATIVVLHLLGTGSLAAPPLHSVDSITSWANHRDPVTIGFSVLRLAALAVAYHLVVTTLLMAIGNLLRLPALVRLADSATLPPLRGTVRRLVGLGLSAGFVLAQPLPTAQASSQASLEVVSSGLAVDPGGRAVLERVDLPGSSSGQAVLERVPLPANPSRPAVLERVGSVPESRGSARLERIDTPEVDLELDVEADAVAEPPTLAVDLGQPAVDRHLVVPGDHLWSIASDRLAQSLGRTPTDAEVAPHWEAVVALNPQLGDPDVLFPGDEVDLPPVPGA